MPASALVTTYFAPERRVQAQANQQQAPTQQPRQNTGGQQQAPAQQQRQQQAPATGRNGNGYQPRQNGNGQQPHSGFGGNQNQSQFEGSGRGFY